MKDSFGDRMKQYEDSYRFKLPARMPVIIRLDGKSFHNYTKKCNKPYDDSIINCMRLTAKKLCEEISDVKVAFTQSDEISLLLINYTNLNTKAWFDNNIQKMASVSASIASVTFTSLSVNIFGVTKQAYFDARTFILPKEEVNNYFVWRQKDCIRNSISAAAQSQFSSQQLNGKSTAKMKEMLLSKNVDWDNFSNKYRNGSTVVKKENANGRFKWTIDEETPVFSLNKDYINKYVI